VVAGINDFARWVHAECLCEEYLRRTVTNVAEQPSVEN
jgi:hypothetical protein